MNQVKQKQQLFTGGKKKKKKKSQTKNGEKQFKTVVIGKVWLWSWRNLR